MLLEALALAHCLEQGGSASARADVPSASVERLTRAAAERGPIRRHLEGAFPSAGSRDVGVPSVGQVHARRKPLQPATAQAPPPAAASRGRVNIGLIVLGALLVYATLYLIAFSSGFDA